MATVLLVRHGLTAMTGPVLAGHTPGVHLDERGTRQAAALGDDRGIEVQADDRLAEVRYGDWTGRPLKELVKEPLWAVVQQHPSAAVFPGAEGEGLAATQTRAVAAIREWDAKVSEQAGPEAVWLACSHGDVIKALVADALGMHLDLFQRISVDPCSVSVIRYTTVRPFVLRVNDTGGDVAGLLPPKRRGRRGRPSSDAAVGGGAGPGG